jgi:hypothetical protein
MMRLRGPPKFPKAPTLVLGDEEDILIPVRHPRAPAMRSPARSGRPLLAGTRAQRESLPDAFNTASTDAPSRARPTTPHQGRRAYAFHTAHHSGSLATTAVGARRVTPAIAAISVALLLAALRRVGEARNLDQRRGDHDGGDLVLP